MIRSALLFLLPPFLFSGCFFGSGPAPRYTLEAKLPAGRQAPLAVEASSLDVRMDTHLRAFTEGPLRFAPDGAVAAAASPRFYAPLDALAADSLRRLSRFVGTAPLRITVRDFALIERADGIVLARVTLAAPGRAPATAETSVSDSATPAEIAGTFGALIGQAYTVLVEPK